MNRSRVINLCAAFTAGTLALAVAVSAPAALAAPLTASTATPRPAQTPKPTRTPRPTKTPRAAGATATTAAPAATRDPNAKLNPEASFALAQKDPCGLIPKAEMANMAATVKTRDGRSWCEYSQGQAAFDVVEIDRDDDGTVLAKSLARFVVNNGCGRDKVPTDADMKPFTSKPLIDKLKLLVEQANKCGSKYAPVAGLGSLAYTDNGNLLIVVDKYLMNAYVQGSKGDEQARKLALRAFVR